MSETKFALYREWRPASFDDVVGQELIVSALQESILNNDLAHAYLFCGTRGTGKTSLAKIFSRAVNCPNIDERANPCNNCECCKSIIDNTVLDVVEMDAASNNSVEDIRRIIEELSYRPVIAKYKVYIIDEAHMLSMAAFNALLKTLEEPPKHVIFILATTDPQRLPATIHSRCQRYDFRRISDDAMSTHLRHISNKIGLKITDEAIKAIVNLSDGAMRDAISLLDQCRSIYEGKKRLASQTSSTNISDSSQLNKLGTQDEITRDDILEITGQVSDHLILSLMTAICKGSSLMLSQVLDQVSSRGIDYSRFCLDLAIYYRHSLLLKCGGKDIISTLPIPEETSHNLLKYIKFYTQSSLIRIVEKLSELSYKLRSAVEARLSLELGLISIMHESLLAQKNFQESKKKIIDNKDRGGAFVAQETISSSNDKSFMTTMENNATNNFTKPTAHTKFGKETSDFNANQKETPEYLSDEIPLIPNDRNVESRLNTELKQKQFSESYASKIPPKSLFQGDFISNDVSEEVPFESTIIYKDPIENKKFFDQIEEENNEPSPLPLSIDSETGEPIFKDESKFNEDDFDNTVSGHNDIEESVTIPYGLGLTKNEKEEATKPKPDYAPLHKVWPDKFPAPAKETSARKGDTIASSVIRNNWSKVLDFIAASGNLALKLVAQSRKYVFEDDKVNIFFEQDENLLYKKFSSIETKQLFSKGIALVFPNADIKLEMIYDDDKKKVSDVPEYQLEWIKEVQELCESSGITFKLPGK